MIGCVPSFAIQLCEGSIHVATIHSSLCPFSASLLPISLPYSPLHPTYPPPTPSLPSPPAPQVTHMYSEKVNGAKKEVVKQSCFVGATQGYSQFAMFSVYGLIIWFGGLDVDQGRSTFDEMLKVCECVCGWV
jgi:hypothetical protein